MKKSVLLFIIISYFINSCCDCSINPVNNPQFECLIRESTITEFNAELVKVDTVLKPGSYYSIHNFVFPENKYLTGTLVNDERFAKTGEIIVEVMPFTNNRDYRLAILDNNPINSNMIGDILVDTVYANNTLADLKFKGDLMRLDSNFLFDDAELFCEYIKINMSIIAQSENLLRKYGEGIAGSKVPKIFLNTDIKILNSNNENVTSKPNVPMPDNVDIGNLLNSVNSKNISIVVKPGDIFLYKSFSGDYFIILVTNIGRGLLSPNKGRVSIMFNSVDL
jgi:CxxC motif-containing protein